MRLIIVCLSIWVLLMVCFPKVIVAHPLDQLLFEVFVDTDRDGKGIENFEAQLEIWISWQELSYIAEKMASPQEAEALSATTGSNNEFQAYLDKLVVASPRYISYFETHVTLMNNDKSCKMAFSLPTNFDNKEALVGKGLRLHADVSCDASLNKVTVFNTVLVDEFPYQSSQLMLYQGSIPLIKNPIEFPKDTRQVKFTIPELQEPASKKSINLMERFTSNLIDSATTWPPLFLLLVYVLGILHTLEAGHSKTILAALLVNSTIGWGKVLMYIAVFVATHVADLVIMGVILLITQSVVDIYQFLPQIQRLAAWTLIFLSAYMFYRSLKQQTHTHHDVQAANSQTSYRQQLWWGFLSGLAPCAFGWSMLMIILSMKNLFVVIPAIMIFGLGIATALVVLARLTFSLREKMYSRLHKFAHWSPLVSYGILFVYALGLLIV